MIIFCLGSPSGVPPPNGVTIPNGVPPPNEVIPLNGIPQVGSHPLMGSHPQKGSPPRIGSYPQMGSHPPNGFKWRGRVGGQYDPLPLNKVNLDLPLNRDSAYWHNCRRIRRRNGNVFGPNIFAIVNQTFINPLFR